MMVAEDCDCSIDDLYAVSFSFKYVEVDAHNVPHIIGRGGRIIRKLETVRGCFLPSQTLRRAHMRCSSLIHVQRVFSQNLPWSY